MTKMHGVNNVKKYTTRLSRVFLPGAAGRIRPVCSAQIVKLVGGLLTVVLPRLAARRGSRAR
jgi:hypothetical protein